MTITFQHQWTNETGALRAVPHISTKNTSFLRTAMLLKKMGIKNYAFPLTLYDPDLKDVDVHALEDNTVEHEKLRTKVQIEARRNVWYFLRECVKIYSQGGEPVSYRLDRGSCAMTWCFINGIDYATMQPRQAQPLSAKVFTPNGFIPMGNVKLGGKVSSPDGSVIEVIGVYPLGKREVYKVTLEDGRSTDCCKDHLWRVYETADLRSKFDILTLEEMIGLGCDHYIPIKRGNNKTILKRVVSIVSIGEEEVQCIEVDHPDHLYITDDFIVTHNTGKTVGAVSLYGWIMYVAGYEYQVGTMAKDNSLREENVKRIKSIGENLPSWWIAEDKFKDKKNTTEILYSALRTHLVTYVANADPRKADLQARGASPPSFWFDEFEFCANINVSYPTILASTGTARENAKKNNKPHSNIITSTAGDPTKPECREAAKILDGAMPFTELLYDLENNEKLHEIVEAASAQKMIMGVFSHLQLGYDNKWLRDKITRNRMSRDQVMRDYLNRRVSIQEEPVIPASTLALINSSQVDPSHIQILANKFVIYWYISKEMVSSQEFRERPIVVGCDSSEMIGRDATTLVGIDPRDLSVVFTFRCNEGNINTLGVMIAQLLLMFPKMVLVPENKSSGTSLIDVISLILRKEGHNPFTRMFNWVVDKLHEQEFAKYNIRDSSLLDTAVKKYFGIKTDKSKRDELYSTTLLDAASKSANRIKDKTLIAELSSLTVRNGRVDHDVGGHDDTVVGWLMAMWFIMNARHLDVYGIKPGTAMSYINPGRPDKSKITQEHQQQVRDKIEELQGDLKLQRDPTYRKLIEADITLLKGLLENTPVSMPETADALLRDPKKFTDPVIAEKSRQPVSSDDIERSMRFIMGVN